MKNTKGAISFAHTSSGILKAVVGADNGHEPALKTRILKSMGRMFNNDSIILCVVSGTYH